MAKHKLDKISDEMRANILNYGKEIQTLKDFVTAVRTRPGMYIGSIGNKGFISLIREIIQNSFDEMNKKDSPCDTVWISYDERTQTIIVEDNGKGIPFGEIIRIFSSQHTSSNFERKPYQYPSGLHGVGAKVTNALSHDFIVESYVLGEGRRVEFTEGYPWDKGEVVIKGCEDKQGSRVLFNPSKEAMGDTSVTVAEVFKLVNMILPLCDMGSTVVFTGIDSKGKEFKEKLVNEDGILTYIIDTVESPLVKPVRLFKDTGMMRGDIVFTYDTNIGDKDNVYDPAKLFAFCNTCPTTIGTHIDGFYEGICYFFTNYMNKIYLAKSSAATTKSKTKKKKPQTLTVKFDDVKFGLIAVISAAHLEPIFDGQSKEKLSNEDMKPFIKGMVMDELDRWSKDNPTDLNKICKYLKDVAEMRVKTDKEKVSISKKYKASSLSGLPSGYVAPIGDYKKEKFEIWFCEGESAAGSMRNDRDNRIQGYYPLKGKIPDAFERARSTFLSNTEVSGMIAIILDGVKDYDINDIGKKPIPVDKIKWDKIIFGTDADSDGDHINALMLRFFVMYMPELILAGKVYAAMPPLYGMVVPGKSTGKYKKAKIQYFIDRLDYIDFLQKNFIKHYDITTHDGKPIRGTALSNLFYKNYDYVYEVDRVAANHSIPSTLLEDVLILRDEKPAVFTKKLKKKYRFAQVEAKGKTTVISGSIGGAIRTVFLNNILINECRKVLDIMNNNESYVYRVNGSLVGLYELMELFNKSEPKSIQRYKGLGEMNGPKLYDSTLDPNNRTLVQYTMEDALATIEKMKYYNNNMRDLLNDIKVSRFDVMD